MEQGEKILYLITQSELGGAQRYIFDLASNLKEELDVSIAFGEQGDEGVLAEKLKQNDINYYSIPHLKRAISPWQDLLAIFAIRKLIKKIKPNIIHLNSSKISILGSLASIFSKSKIIYTAHGWVFNEPLSKFKKSFYLHAEKFTAKFKNKIICVSVFDHKAALENKIAPKEKLITIHNGIEKIHIQTKDLARALLSKSINQQLNNDETIIGSVGNLYKTKGFEYFIKAIKILVDNKINIKAVIIGEGREREELEDWIDQLYLKNHVILPGRIDKVAELLPALDVYICSSVKEGLSYTVIEAMMASLPIVATHVGGNPELITDSQEGLLVKAADPEKLAQTIIKLINNPELSNNLAKNAKAKAEKEFTLEKMVNKTKGLYR